nr:hypothetical protein [Candidatus Sigynarchaeota archaeon]
MSSRKTACFICGKQTDMICPGCQRPICSSHAGLVKRRFWCPDCFYDQRKKGLILSWSFVIIMIVVGIIAIYFFRK